MKVENPQLNIPMLNIHTCFPKMAIDWICGEHIPNTWQETFSGFAKKCALTTIAELLCKKITCWTHGKLHKMAKLKVQQWRKRDKKCSWIEVHQTPKIQIELTGSTNPKLLGTEITETAFSFWFSVMQNNFVNAQPNQMLFAFGTLHVFHKSPCFRFYFWSVSNSKVNHCNWQKHSEAIELWWTLKIESHEFENFYWHWIVPKNSHLKWHVACFNNEQLNFAAGKAKVKSLALLQFETHAMCFVSSFHPVLACCSETKAF